MEFEVSLDTEQQFWDEIQEITSTPCSSEGLIDNALRSYLGLTTKYKDEYLKTEVDISRCLFKLFVSDIFAAHADYVRRQFLYGLLQEDDPKTLHLIASFLLFDGRQNEATLHMMNEEGSFSRLLELLQAQRSAKEEGNGEGEDGAGLHRVLMDMLYEMSRIQRIRIEDLVLVDDDFIEGLFEIIEDLSYDANDPYHYPVIRVLLVLNEQFMISAHDPLAERSPSNPLTNKVIKVLSIHGNRYKTFGENIILLINREAETSLQLLTLKLLYLIFTTPSTYEYFYTNDLHVLVDILIRNLLDLPEEASALRHTYLRVLYPLLAHTQLKYPPHYKRDELLRMLNILVRGQFSDGESDYEKILHFEEVDETTKRLVVRCATVEWLKSAEEAVAISKPLSEDIPLPQVSVDDVPTIAEAESPLEISRTITETSSPEEVSPTRVDKPVPAIPNLPPKPTHAERLGMHLDPASTSSLSVQEVAAQHEKPGIITPSRGNHAEFEPKSPSPTKSQRPKVKPEPPKSRRWRGRRPTIGENAKPAEDSELTSRSVDRRNSAGSTLAPPPVPTRAHRSASTGPPAVPPPRRSAHHHHGNGSSSAGSSTGGIHGKHGQKPEPPKTRRWGRARHAQSESVKSEKVDSPVDSEYGEKSHDSPTVTVEEAVQNVSLG